MAVPSNHETVTVSLGATALERDDLDAATVLRRADTALYDAKEHGRNRVESSDSPNTTTEDPLPEGISVIEAAEVPRSAAHGDYWRSITWR
jgi:hypothetical protein